MTVNASENRYRRLGEIEPFGASLDGLEQRGQEPGESALHPHRLVSLQHRSIAIEGGEIAAVLAVDRPRDPEREGIV
jgi:hypothetical protein